MMFNTSKFRTKSKSKLHFSLLILISLFVFCHHGKGHVWHLSKTPVQSRSEKPVREKFNPASFLKKLSNTINVTDGVLERLQTPGVFHNDQVTLVPYDIQFWSQYPWTHGHVFGLLECKWKDCLSECGKLGGYPPQMVTTAQITKVKEMLEPHSVTFQILDLDIDQKAYIHELSRIRYAIYEGDKIKYESIDDLITAAKSANTASPGMERRRRNAPADTTLHWDALLYEHEHIMGYDYELSDYVNLAPAKRTQSTKQICMIPVSTSSNLLLDQASWKFVDESLTDRLTSIREHLSRLIKTLHDKGLTASSIDPEHLDQKLPRDLLEVSLSLTRLAHSHGSLDDAMWALNWIESSSNLVQKIQFMIDRVSDGMLDFGSTTCYLSNHYLASDLHCVEYDATIPWYRIDFFAHSDGPEQLTFDHFEYNSWNSSECMMERGLVHLRLPDACCEALLNATSDPIPVCPSTMVSNTGIVSLLQDDYHQVYFGVNSSEDSPCINRPFFRGSPKYDSCVEDSLRLVPKLVVPQSIKAHKTLLEPITWRPAVIYALAGLGSGCLLWGIVNLLRCSCHPWLKRYFGGLMHETESTIESPPASSAESRPFISPPSVRPEHPVRPERPMRSERQSNSTDAGDPQPRNQLAIITNAVCMVLPFFSGSRTFQNQYNFDRMHSALHQADPRHHDRELVPCNPNRLENPIN